MSKKGDGNRTSKVFVGKDIHTFWTKIPSIVGLVAIIAILTLALLKLLPHKKTDNSAKNSTNSNNAVNIKTNAVCTMSEVTSATNAILTNTNQDVTSKLAPMINKITQVSGLNETPDCLYVLSVYYLNTGDTSSAQKYLGDLEKLGGSKVALDSRFTPILSFDDMKASLANNSKSAKNNQQSTIKEP